MKIFTQIKNSVYNKEYYQSVVLGESTRSSVRYLAKLVLLLSLIASIIFAISLPSWSKKVREIVSPVVSEYPDDLVITLKDGELSVNRPAPYIIKVPDNIKNLNDKKIEETEDIKNMIVIDTEKPFSLDKFKEYSTAILLTKTEIISMQSNRGELRITPLSKLGDVEITKTLVSEKGAKFIKMLPWIVTLLVPIVFAGIFIGIFIGTLIALFFCAALVWIIFKIKKTDISYRKSYQVALHASTLVIIISVFGGYLGWLNSSLIKLLIFVIIVLVNFSGYSRDQEEIEEAVIISVE